MYAAVVETVLKILEKAKFRVTNLVETKPRCFDIVARKGDIIILLKALYNVDSLKSDMAAEMRLVAKLMEASPLVVGERFKFDYLERGVIYNRYRLPVINTATFYDFIMEGIPPIIYSAPGGYYVKIDSEKIKEAREKLGISVGELAKLLGVSRRCIKKYEEEGIDTSLEHAIKLEEVLGVYVIKAIDLLGYVNEDIKPKEVELKHNEAEIVEQLRYIGIKVYPVRHAPFDVVSQTEDKAVLTGIRQVREIGKRAAIIGKVSEVLSTKAAYIVEREIKEDISSVVFLMKEELSCVSSAKDFITLLNEKNSNQK